MYRCRKFQIPLLAICLQFMAAAVFAQVVIHRDVPCCNIDDASGIVWTGTDTLMTLKDLATYCGPVLWFSPDEPLLPQRKRAAGIKIPTTFPFETPSDGPVAYYRVRNLVTVGDTKAFYPDSTDRNDAIIDLSKVTGIDLDYFFYYPSEEGFGGHQHDVESVEMKLAVYFQPDCDECRYGISVLRVNGKAHGVLWYDNTLNVDPNTRFPITILVEEGKHASCTDKNGDGYYTPGYDVNERVNDAWGVRDIMRSGTLYTGGFQSWFAKVRVPRDRVYPPVPEVMVLREWYVDDGVPESEYTRYSVRPFPRKADAEEYAKTDPHIERFVDKGPDDWPYQEEKTEFTAMKSWFDEESFVKSLSIAARYSDTWGLSFVFPLFIVKNYNDPVSGGWLLNRIILSDTELRDFSWQLLYSPSASRWIDGYFSAGIFVDSDGVEYENHFMSESGLKFRFNIAHTPVRFLSPITDFWGLRVGIRYIGYNHFSDLGYALEVGAGTF